MPTYSYTCDACGESFEKEQRISEEPLKKCELCGKLKARRQIVSGNFILKGGGWYSDGYGSGKSSSGTNGSKTDSSSESKASDSSSKTDSSKSDSSKSESGKSDSSKSESGKSETTGSTKSVAAE